MLRRRTIAVALASLVVACSGSHRDEPTPRPVPTTPPTPIPTTPPPPPVPARAHAPLAAAETTLVCGRVHAHLPEGATLDESSRPCELPGMGRATDGSGFLGGGSTTVVRFDGCTIELEANEAFAQRTPEATPLDAIPADGFSLAGPMSQVDVAVSTSGNAPGACVRQRDDVVYDVVRTARVDGPPPAGDARVPVSTNGTRIALRVPDGYMIAYAGYGDDEFESAWLLLPIHGDGAAATLYTYFAVESGMGPERSAPVATSLRAFGRRADFRTGEEPEGFTRRTPCIGEAFRGGPDLMETAVWVCGDDATRATVLGAVASMRFVHGG